VCHVGRPGVGSVRTTKNLTVPRERHGASVRRRSADSPGPKVRLTWAEASFESQNVPCRCVRGASWQVRDLRISNGSGIVGICGNTRMVELVDVGVRTNGRLSLLMREGDGAVIGLRRVVCLAALSGALLVVPAGVAGAIQNPTTGQPGTTAGFNCGTSTAPVEPGHAATAPGAAFNESGSGVAGMNYAGNDGTASLAHAGSTAAVSQYDSACRRLSS
jgi:hypothetical protein